MINLDEWEVIDMTTSKLGVRSRAVEIFLKNNPNNAFTQKEIFESVKDSFKDYKDEDKAKANLSRILSNLKKIEILESKSPYWKIKNTQTCSTASGGKE